MRKDARLKEQVARIDVPRSPKPRSYHVPLTKPGEGTGGRIRSIALDAMVKEVGESGKVDGLYGRRLAPSRH